MPGSPLRLPHMTWPAALVATTLACGDSNPRAGDDDDDDDAPGVQDALGGDLAFQEVSFPDAPAGATSMAFVPGRPGELVLGTREGAVFHLRIADAGVETLGSFPVSEVALPQDCGLVSLAFDPDYETNGWLYVGQCFSVQDTGVVRYTLDLDDLGTAPATRVEVLRLSEPRSTAGWHNVGHLRFDAAGNMVVTVGDKTQACNAQDPENDLGAVLRVVPSADGGSTPSDGNPFLGDDSRADAIWAYGFRSPWASRIDRGGRLWVADVGNRDFEEVSLVDPGENYGWPRAEGPCLDTGWPDDCSVGGCDGLTDPVVSWDRSNSHPYVRADPEVDPMELSRAAWVGASYPGDLGGPDRYEGVLDDVVLFGDLCAGFVRGISADDQGRLTLDAPVGHLQNAVAWEVGHDGFVYAATYGRCGFGDPTPPDPTRIHRLVPAD